MNINVRNAEKLLKFLSDLIIKNSIYPVPNAKAKIFKRYSPRHLLLSRKIHLLQVQPVAVQPSDAIRPPVRMEERAEEIKVK